MSEPRKTLDDKGQCCGRNPIPYKRPRESTHLFCMACAREYDGNEQIENWAWKQNKDGTFTRNGAAS